MCRCYSSDRFPSNLAGQPNSAAIKKYPTGDSPYTHAIVGMMPTPRPPTSYVYVAAKLTYQEAVGAPSSFAAALKVKRPKRRAAAFLPFSSVLSTSFSRYLPSSRV